MDHVKAASGYVDPFHLVLVRPHRVFTQADLGSSVADLGDTYLMHGSFGSSPAGLLPSAVLAVSRA